MKCALYIRVSTEEQDEKNQLEPLQKFADALGLEIFRTYSDKVSGGDSNRPGFKAMMEDAQRHEFGVILVWALDRFSREGIVNTLAYIKKLRAAGVSLKSLQESWLDTRDEGMGQLLIAIFSWVAEQERKKISERTKAGMVNAINVGKRGADKKPRKRAGYFLRHSPHLKEGGINA
jgi:DNA invertase Pin-like site-specific DNA recombinase